MENLIKKMDDGINEMVEHLNAIITQNERLERYFYKLRKIHIDKN